MKSHTHTASTVIATNTHNHLVGGAKVFSAGTNRSGALSYYSSISTTDYSTSSRSHSHTATTTVSSVGSVNPTPFVNPFVVVHIWERIN